MLSTTTGTPLAWATSAIAAMSWTSRRGLPIVSRKTALVRPSIAGANVVGLGAVDEAAS